MLAYNYIMAILIMAILPPNSNQGSLKNYIHSESSYEKKEKTLNDGSVSLSGLVINGKLSGEGTRIRCYHEGNFEKIVYTGRFEEGRYHGPGTMVEHFRQGNVLMKTYSGTWKNDKLGGEVVLKIDYSEGAKSCKIGKGNWVNGYLSEKARNIETHMKNGSKISVIGDWKDGKLYNGKKIFIDRTGEISKIVVYVEGKPQLSKVNKDTASYLFRTLMRQGRFI